jgi:aminopeptidase YwaD
MITRFLLTSLVNIFIISSLFITSSLFSQSAGTPTEEIKKGEVYTYARKIVDTMASENMHGRGYVNDGDKIAANYIRTEFKKFGLKTSTEDYYQKFSFPINTFPDTIDFWLTIDYFDPEKKEKKCQKYIGVPGVNFLISPESPTVVNNLYAVTFDSTYTTSPQKFKKFKRKIKFNNTFIIVDDRGIIDKRKLEYFKKVKGNYFGTIGIIEFVKKLTWEQSQTVSKYTTIQIPIDSFNVCTNFFIGVLNLKNHFIPNYPTQNVISYIEGSEHPDSFIVFSAHYDHLGQMGKDTYFPGANDNASGCAMLLNLAKYYSMPEHKPKCSIAFIAFGGEEVGLLGSKYYTEHPLFPLKNIKFLLNMDIMGTGEEGITVVNGTLFKPEFEKLKQINTENNFIKDVKIRGKAANSDHYFFSENGVKSFFIYTMGGIKAYHDIYDRAETLPLNEFEDLFKMITKFGEYLQN